MGYKKIMVCINGSGGTGKDSFVDFCKTVAYSQDIFVANLSTVDKVKKAGRILGCTGKSEEDRKFLSDLKDLAKKYNNHSRTYIEEQIRYFHSSNTLNTIIFVHAREPEEIAEFKKYFVENGIVDDFLSVLVSNSNVKKIDTNHADGNVNNYLYDYYIENNRELDELRDIAKVFVSYINSEFFTDHKGEC